MKNHSFMNISGNLWVRHNSSGRLILASIIDEVCSYKTYEQNLQLRSKGTTIMMIPTELSPTEFLEEMYKAGQ